MTQQPSTLIGTIVAGALPRVLSSLVMNSVSVGEDAVVKLQEGRHEADGPVVVNTPRVLTWLEHGKDGDAADVGRNAI